MQLNNLDSARQRFNNDMFLVTAPMSDLNRTVQQSPERIYYTIDKPLPKKSSLFNSSQKEGRVLFVDDNRQLQSSRAVK